MQEKIRVGMAEMKVCSVPDTITTLGLGSCVGVVLYDSQKKICGLIHVMLPDSTRIKNHSNRAKFADTAIVDMLSELEKLGCRRRNIIAKIAGGAKMFEFGSDKRTTSILSIGEENIRAVREILSRENIPLKAQDVGLNYGRTIIFNPENGELFIKAVGKEDKII